MLSGLTDRNQNGNALPVPRVNENMKSIEVPDGHVTNHLLFPKNSNIRSNELLMVRL